MSQHSINLVREFHKKFEHPVASELSVADQKMRKLRVELIAEELGELCDALGVILTMYCNKVTWVEASPDDSKVDLVEVADALGDLDYVVQGGNLVFGIPAEKVIQEIHRSNMSKLGENGEVLRREDGKILKSTSYSPPDLKRVLQEDAEYKAKLCEHGNLNCNACGH